MDAIAPGLERQMRRSRPSREDAESAVRTLIEWAGDDPDREGLLGTPDRVVRAYEEFYAGYHEDPKAILERKQEATMKSSCCATFAWSHTASITWCRS